MSAVQSSVWLPGSDSTEKSDMVGSLQWIFTQNKDSFLRFEVERAPSRALCMHGTTSFRFRPMRRKSRIATISSFWKTLRPNRITAMISATKQKRILSLLSCLSTMDVGFSKLLELSGLLQRSLRRLFSLDTMFAPHSRPIGFRNCSMRTIDV